MDGLATSGRLLGGEPAAFQRRSRQAACTQKRHRRPSGQGVSAAPLKTSEDRAQVGPGRLHSTGCASTTRGRQEDVALRNPPPCLPKVGTWAAGHCTCHSPSPSQHPAWAGTPNKPCAWAPSGGASCTMRVPSQATGLLPSPSAAMSLHLACSRTLRAS